MMAFLYRVIGLVMAVGSAIVLFTVLFSPVPWVIAVIVPLWLAALSVVQSYLRRIATHEYASILLTTVTAFSILALLSLAEVRALQYLLIVGGSGALGLLFLLCRPQPPGATFEHKRVRRIFMMFWVFNAFALVTTLHALPLFFPQLPFVVSVVVGGVIYGAIAYAIWRLYHPITLRTHGIWVLLFTLAGMELLWAMHLLPFGFFGSGWMTTWLWYLGQLFTRFHFGSRGIVWERQRWFVLVNAILYTGVLAFFIRWV